MLALFGLASAHAQTYTFTDLGRASGVASAAAGINNAGQVVGLYADGSNQNHAVAWIDGQATELGSASTMWGYGGFTNPWGVSGSAISINDAGQIAWTSREERAMLWNQGVATDLGTLGGAQSQARGINEAGQIVGQAQNSDGAWRAVAWRNGQATELSAPAGSPSWQANAVNGSGQIVGAGVRTSDHTVQPVMWNQGVATNMDAPWTHSYQITAYGINDAGLAVGSTKVPNDVDYYRAILWNQDGTGTLLDMPQGFEASEAKGINNAGQIVGFMMAPGSMSPDFRAATWINGQVVDLNSLLPASAVAEGWVLQGANAINDAGAIVGQAYNTKTGVTDGFVLTPVPESSTFAMLLLGLGALGMVVASRRAVGHGLEAGV
jgi:probable HAF family extracellular repeat protein